MWQVSTTERLFLVQPPSQGQLFVTPRFVGSSVHTRVLFPVMSESLGIHHRVQLSEIQSKSKVHVLPS